VLLQDLPVKTIHRLLKSVTWTEVDAAFATKNPLRRFVSRISQRGRWVVSVPQGRYVVVGRMIDRLLRIRAATGWFRGRFKNRMPALRVPIPPKLAQSNEEIVTMAQRWRGKEGRWGERVKVNIPV
jgi:hypothetical protein